MSEVSRGMRVVQVGRRRRRMEKMEWTWTWRIGRTERRTRMWKVKMLRMTILIERKKAWGKVE